ncbi:MAG: cell division protein FtsL [Rhodobacteraceae bacterium]|nr:cell division protein FtsL [Paracoccaceae bacterium]
MRGVFYVLSCLAVMGLAWWAYRENYATQESLREVGRLQAEIAWLRESLAVQRAEWAYLNRPARLAALVALNFDRLQLLPMEAGQFGAIGQIAYPPIGGALGRSVTLSSDGEGAP